MNSHKIPGKTSNYVALLPCRYCGHTGFHIWGGEGFCPGLTEGLDGKPMPESMYYYQLGFNEGFKKAKELVE